MSLVHETGSGLVNAESYSSVADADTYHSNFGNTSWAAADDADKEIALRKATRYIDTKFNGDWFGQRTNSAQALDWPRSYVRDNDGYYLNGNVLPNDLKNACAVLALLALTEDIYANIDAESGSPTAKKIVVGPITIEKRFSAGGAESSKIYRLADDMLMQFVSPGGSLERG